MIKNKNSNKIKSLSKRPALNSMSNFIIQPEWYTTQPNKKIDISVDFNTFLNIKNQNNENKWLTYNKRKIHEK